MEVEMNVAGLHHHHHHQQQQQQDVSSQILEGMLMCTKPPQQEDKKPRPPAAEAALKCPRCDSFNTKFCYYNNYSLTQPRYFCKSCRRYWTKGGTLRNVPVGGGCRKNRRSSHSSSSSAAATSSSISSSSYSALQNTRFGPQDHHIIQQHPLSLGNHMLAGLPNLPYDSTDLSLAFARLQGQANGSMGCYDQFDHLDSFFFPNMNTNTNMLYVGSGTGTGNPGNGEVVGFNQEQQHILNPMFYDNNQEQIEVKQEEACNMMRSSELWGFHEVESMRSMIGGGSTNWNGLINSPLM